MSSIPLKPAQPLAQRGFTMVELMIAITIALFLSLGLLTLVQAMKRTAMVQGGLSQLQDNQRMAMNLISDVIQQAGYFPNPQSNTAAGMFPINAQFPSFAGQSVVGSGAWNDPAQPGNSITIRYATGGTVVVPPATPDYAIDCTGNPSNGPTTFTNTFSIQPDAVDPTTFDLTCTVLNSAVGPPPTTVYLVNGVTQMQIKYGVQTNPGVSNGSADTYLDAATMGTSYWNTIVSVKVTLTFVNPLHGTLAGQSMTAPATISITCIIDVMNKTGVT
jgi:type IV pilus assembly protein PilW